MQVLSHEKWRQKHIWELSPLSEEINRERELYLCTVYEGIQPYGSYSSTVFIFISVKSMIFFVSNVSVRFYWGSEFMCVLFTLI